MKRILTLMLGTLLLVAVSCKKDSTSPAAVDNTPRVQLAPSDATVSVGNTTQLELRVQNLTPPIFAVSLEIGYCDSLAAFSDSTGFATGEFFGTSAVPFCQAENSAVHIALTKTQGQAAIGGSGTLCTLTFSGRAAGTCLLDILSANLHFYDSTGSEVSISELEVSGTTLHVN
jgi:hypothetical protein